MSATSIARVHWIEEIVASLRRQLAKDHDIDARYVGKRVVRDRTVLEFRAVNRRFTRLHVIVDGSGPGRAAWVVGALSAEQAVEASEWNASLRTDADEAMEPQALDGLHRELRP